MSFFSYTEASGELGRYIARRMKYHSESEGKTIGVYCFVFVAMTIVTIGLQLLTGTALVIVPVIMGMMLLGITFTKYGDCVKGMNRYNWRWWWNFTQYSCNLYLHGGILDGSIDLDDIDNFLAGKEANTWDVVHASPSRPRATRLYIPGFSQSFRSIMLSTNTPASEVDETLKDSDLYHEMIIYFRNREDLIEFKMRVL